jgi:hypothetical protein
MCSEVGWKHAETVKTLEEKRKVKAGAFWAKKKELIQVKFMAYRFKNSLLVLLFHEIVMSQIAYAFMMHTFCRCFPSMY